MSIAATVGGDGMEDPIYRDAEAMIGDFAMRAATCLAVRRFGHASISRSLTLTCHQGWRSPMRASLSMTTLPQVYSPFSIRLTMFYPPFPAACAAGFLTIASHVKFNMDRPIMDKPHRFGLAFGHEY